jgi:hypothetical protein
MMPQFFAGILLKKSWRARVGMASKNKQVGSRWQEKHPAPHLRVYWPGNAIFALTHR